LLSIHSFQRGLADQEQLIRALALRVLSSIRIPDIVDAALDALILSTSTTAATQQQQEGTTFGAAERCRVKTK
jgi:vesicle coat complex subunit